MRQQVAIAVTDASQVGEARRAASTLAERSHLNQTDVGRVQIIVTELANNLVRYGKGGTLWIGAQTSLECGGSIQILALDAGPGMDTAKCLADGYSTGGTPGNGLGAVSRLAVQFDIYSTAASGTVVMATVGPSEQRADKIQWGCICLPAPGETLCGDAVGYGQNGNRAGAMIADGLGHGPDAATASTAALRVFNEDAYGDPSAFLQLSHQALVGTRGAAVAIASLDARKAQLRYAGVGNIAGTLFSAGARKGLASGNGIVGAILPRIHTFEYPLAASGMLILHSDGLQSRWSLDSYPGLQQRHPLIIAGVLFRDFYRGRDDVTVLVAAWQGGIS